MVRRMEEFVGEEDERVRGRDTDALPCWRRGEGM